MKKIIRWFTFLILFLMPVAHAGELELSLFSESNEILLGQRLLISVIVKNISEKDILIPVSWTCESLLLTVQGGDRQYAFCLERGDMIADTECLLKPGQWHSRQFDAVQRLVMEPGSCKVTAAYRSPGVLRSLVDIDTLKTVEKECWKGEVETVPLEIRIRAPESPQDKAALGVLRRGSGMVSPYLYAFAPDHELAGAVIREYPKSEYARYCEYAMGESYARNAFPSANRSWIDKAMPHLKATVENYPRFSFTDDAIFLMAKLMWRTGEQDEARQLISKLKTEFPDCDTLKSMEWKRLVEEMKE